MSIIINMKNFLSKLKDNKIFIFLISENFFVWLVGGFILLFWMLDAWIFGIIALCLLAAVSFFFCKDTSRILAILFMFVMIISANRHNLNNFMWVLFVSVGLLVAGLIFHIIYYKPPFKLLLKERRIKGFSLSLILLAIPMAFGGIARGDRNAAAVLLVTAYIIVVSVFYLFFLVTTEKKKGEDMLRYIILIMLVAGIVITIQMLTYYIRLGDFDKILRSVRYKEIQLGWAGPNNVAPMLSLTLPACFYYAIKKKNYGFLFIILAVIQYILILSTSCRGTILFTTLALPFILCYTMAKTENKLAVGLTFSLCFCALIFLLAIYGENFVDIITRMVARGLDDSGRMSIYQSAVDTFKQFPLFGAGWDYRLGEMAGDGYSPYWYHSTPLQIMANMGVLGILFFAYFTYWRYRSGLFTKKYQISKFTVMAGMLLFELYGLIDVNYFGPTFFITMIIMSFAIEKSLDENECNPYLFNKLLNKVR